MKFMRFDAPSQAFGHGGEQERRRAQYRLRSMLLAVLVAGIWLFLLIDPMTGPLIVMALGALGLTIGVVLGAMALGGIGFGLFALGDRAVAWCRRAATWYDR